MRLLYYFIAILLVLFISNGSYASIIVSSRGDATPLPPAQVQTLSPWKIINTLTPSNYKALTGKKMTLKERVILRLLQFKAKHNLLTAGEPTERQRKQGKLSLIFGAIALPLLFVPYAGIVALPLAIAGLVLGVKSLKGNNQTQGILGVVFSATVLFIFLLAVIVLTALLSGGIY